MVAPNNSRDSYEATFAGLDQIQSFCANDYTSSTEAAAVSAVASATETRSSLPSRSYSNPSIEDDVQTNTAQSLPINSVSIRKPHFTIKSKRTQEKQSAPQGVKKDRPWLQSNVIIFSSKSQVGQQICKTNTPIQRAETKALRQRGACFRCRMWRKKVNASHHALR